MTVIIRNLILSSTILLLLLKSKDVLSQYQIQTWLFAKSAYNNKNQADNISLAKINFIEYSTIHTLGAIIILHKILGF